MEVKAIIGTSLSVRTVTIEYICGESMGVDSVPQIFYAASSNLIQIGIGKGDLPTGSARCFTRHLQLDLLKGLGYRARKTIKKVKVKLRNVASIRFIGRGSITAVTLANKRYEVCRVLTRNCIVNSCVLIVDELSKRGSVASRQSDLGWTVADRR